MRPVALILSPHLDDASLSCGTLIQRIFSMGQLPIIVTVFTHSNVKHQAQYRKRRADDRNAAKILNAKVVHLGFKDAPFRSAAYQSFPGITFGEDPEFSKTVREVSRSFARLVLKLTEKGHPIDFILAPLGVGNHVDHRITRDAALALPKKKLVFYEERPYAFLREQVDHVFGLSMALRPKVFWKKYFLTPYVKTYLGDTSPAEVVAKWGDVGSVARKINRRNPVTLHPHALEIKKSIRAILAYQDQWPDLFRTQKNLLKLYRDAHEVYYPRARSSKLALLDSKKTGQFSEKLSR